ncbi:MAG: DJ-1/PfpI family protein [Bacteroidota bacterium]
MKKVLLLLADGFEMYEASVFVDVIGWNQVYGTQDTQLATCGLTKHLKSTFGIKMEVDLLVSEVDPSDYSALAVPGGFEIFGFYKDAFSLPFQELIQQFNEDQKIISSICTGALPLAKSGILNNRPATTYNHSGKERQIQLAGLGAKVIPDQPIVIDGNVTTSWSPVTAMEVAFGLLKQLTNAENVDHIKKIMGFIQ